MRVNVMKIKTKIFREFLEKVRMDGHQAIDEVLFQFEATGLKIVANSKAQLSSVNAELKASAFANYEPIGKIGIGELGIFNRALKRFEETIDIVKSGNVLTLKEDKKSVDVELVSEDYIEGMREAPNLEYEEEFKLTAKKLNEIYGDALLNSDANIIISTKKASVVFQNSGKFKFTSEFDAPTCNGGAVVKFGEALIDATKSLTGDLVINVKSDFPITVKEETDTSVIRILVAPLVDTE